MDKIREFLSLVKFGDIEDRRCGYLTPLINFHLSFLLIQNNPKYKHVIPNRMIFCSKTDSAPPRSLGLPVPEGSWWKTSGEKAWPSTGPEVPLLTAELKE